MEVEGAFNILTRASGYSAILMAELSRSSKLNAGFLMEHELQRLLRDRLFYRAFPLSLFPLSLYVSLPLSLIKSRREFTGTAGRQGLITPRSNTGMYCMR